MMKVIPRKRKKKDAEKDMAPARWKLTARQ